MTSGFMSQTPTDGLGVLVRTSIPAPGQDLVLRLHICVDWSCERSHIAKYQALLREFIDNRPAILTYDDFIVIVIHQQA